nr:MAG TPA: hypothetical protein [Caudoviricetes sp.]DAN98633.1 MAG TPA: hypothetical protein [Caudoviricetes sp.]
MRKTSPKFKRLIQQFFHLTNNQIKLLESLVFRKQYVLRRV